MKEFKLDKDPKIETGFKIPEDYFDHFSSNLIQKIQKEDKASNEPSKVISIFRTRKNILMAAAAVLLLAIMIPIAYKANQKKQEVDALTIENYLTQESNLNQYELIGELETQDRNLLSVPKELETETIEDMLVRNPNIENLVIEN